MMQGHGTVFWISAFNKLLPTNPSCFLILSKTVNNKSDEKPKQVLPENLLGLQGEKIIYLNFVCFVSVL